MGLKNCSGGLKCYVKDAHFSQCLSNCPLGIYKFYYLKYKNYFTSDSHFV